MRNLLTGILLIPLLSACGSTAGPSEYEIDFTNRVCNNNLMKVSASVCSCAFKGVENAFSFEEFKVAVATNDMSFNAALGGIMGSCVAEDASKGSPAQTDAANIRGIDTPKSDASSSNGSVALEDSPEFEALVQKCQEKGVKELEENSAFGVSMQAEAEVYDECREAALRELGP